MWNPTRRNKNIGTSKQGYGKSNKLTIPNPCAVSKTFYERLDSYNKVERTINEHKFTFIIEATRDACQHACQIEDIASIIENIPVSDYGELKLIILRQPKRKEEILSPVWGRLIYSYEFEGNYCPAIIIEAINYDKKISWDKSQSPEDQKEFARLKMDGHNFLEGKKSYTAFFKKENVRNTQLYRTLPHEFGHYVHYLETVERASVEDEDFEGWEVRYNAFFKISKKEKEKYAHKYADELLKRLKEKIIIPFETKIETL